MKSLNELVLETVNQSVAEAKQQAFDVVKDGKVIDTVFFAGSMTCKEVKDSLVSHDGYDSDIKVVRQGKAVAEDLESVTEATDASFHAKEIKAAIEAAKSEGVDFVRCKFGDSKFVNIGIAHLEKLAAMV